MFCSLFDGTSLREIDVFLWKSLDPGEPNALDEETLRQFSLQFSVLSRASLSKVFSGAIRIFC